MPTLADTVCRVASVADPHGGNLSFPDRFFNSYIYIYMHRYSLINNALGVQDYIVSTVKVNNEQEGI